MPRNSTGRSEPAVSSLLRPTFSADERAAVEPVAALVAVVVVGLALGLYAGAFADAASGDDR